MIFLKTIFKQGVEGLQIMKRGWDFTAALLEALFLIVISLLRNACLVSLSNGKFGVASRNIICSNVL